MENTLNGLVQFIIGLVKDLFGKDLTATQAQSWLMLFFIFIIVILLISLLEYKHKYKVLRKRVIKGEVQVITIPRGKKGKTRMIIKTKKDLRNPKKNKKIVKEIPNNNAKKTVVNIRED